jgi:hypothetical protein
LAKDSPELCCRCGKRPATIPLFRHTQTDYKIPIPLCDPCHAIYAYEHGWKPLHIMDLMDIGKVVKAKQSLEENDALQKIGLNRERINEILAYLEREQAYLNALKQMGKPIPP